MLFLLTICPLLLKHLSVLSLSLSHLILALTLHSPQSTSPSDNTSFSTETLPIVTSNPTSTRPVRTQILPTKFKYYKGLPQFTLNLLLYVFMHCISMFHIMYFSFLYKVLSEHHQRTCSLYLQRSCGS